MKIIIKEVKTRKELDDFTMLPFDLYKNDQGWVPPLIYDFKKYVLGKNNSLNQSGKNIKLIAYKKEKPVARLLVGINDSLNKEKIYKEGYIALYECIDDFKISYQILRYAENFLKKEGVLKIIGPLSLPGGEEHRGFLVDNFEDPTLIMNIYNKKYYNKHFLNYGFNKYSDVYGFKSDFAKESLNCYEKIVPYFQKKYKFNVKRIDLKNLKKELRDIKEIIEKSIPKDCDDFIPPNEEEILLIVKQLKPYADPDFIYIARDYKENPIAFNIALPDYNQVLKKMNGKILPFGMLKFLYYKRKIDRLRVFVLFIVPEYRSKGVTESFYLERLKKAIEKDYKYGESSTIWEYNTEMKNYASSLSKPYKTYRIYIKDID